MNTNPKSLFRLLLTATILLTSLASSVGTVFAADGVDEIIISVVASAEIIQCGEAEFNISWTGGSHPYQVEINYGDEDSIVITVDDTSITSITHKYTYVYSGDFAWTVQVSSSGVLSPIATGTLTLVEGPEVIFSDIIPFPPVFVFGEDGSVDFTASASGGTPPYQFTWNLGGDGAVVDPSDPSKASSTYSEAGKYQAQVMVIDDCGFSATATMPVVVSDPENACHPTAQKIADAVNTIFPDQAEDLYTCEDIYAIFDGDPDGSNTGFGRMWKAYNLALTMEELTWEDIRDWHLDVGGWGGLLQLDRFADLLDEQSLPDLMGLVMSEEFSLGDVRLAVRSYTRFDADFNDALDRIADGANPGELGQLYKLAQDLEVDPTAIDGYLGDGMTLSELKHAANFADRVEADWEEIAQARTSADSWGDIGQAYRLATEDISAAEILINGVQEYKKDLRDTVHETAKDKKSEEQASQQEVKIKNTGEKLAEQFSAEFGDVMNLFNGECEGDWACVRKTLRTQEQTQSEGFTKKDQQTALQIASKYGFSEEEVQAYNTDSCSGDWACTRTHFRDLYMSTKETGKPPKDK